MRLLDRILFLSLILFSVPNFASEVLKKEITFFAIHPMKEIHGVCKEVQIDSPKIEFAGGAYKLNTPFQIKVPVLKFHSGDENRDSHIMEILGYPETPEISAIIESVSQSGVSYSIKGKLTIRGITQTFDSAAKVEPKEGGRIRVVGKVDIKFSDFKLERPSLLFLKAKEEIEIGYDFLIQI
ncbi:YceI family protein [Leptospira sp. 201903070]|uniref:YceI family protein n=1 Tax=Leptospira ainlahdjerensis TaxID=2810033 RepID=A0ABS2UGG0_9LEPT|nr:YceI family protein [Leptospira ainlahdjerensis]MBM9579449.1 YceI family protein [Leptospira ainlahdjerensis]